MRTRRGRETRRRGEHSGPLKKKEEKKEDERDTGAASWKKFQKKLMDFGRLFFLQNL